MVKYTQTIRRLDHFVGLAFNGLQLPLNKCEYVVIMFNPFQTSVAFHMETSRLTCIANQMTGFYMKCITELKWVNGGVSDFVCERSSSGFESRCSYARFS